MDFESEKTNGEKPLNLTLILFHNSIRHFQIILKIKLVN